MDETSKITMPKKACLITLMFGIKDDAEGLAVKQIVDDAIKEISEKRYTFQITET